MVASLFSSKKLLPDIWVPTFEIKVNGTALPEEVAKSVEQVTVTQVLGQADSFMFQLNDPKLKLTKKDGLLTEGKQVEISMGYVGKEKKRKLLVGKISAVSVSFPSSGAAAIQVEGFDRSHELTYGTQYRKFEQSMSDSKIVSEIASEIGFSASVDATPQRKETRTQENITSWSFLTDLAIANGYSLWIADDTLYFKKTPPTPKQPGQPKEIDLEYGKTLLSFNPRLSTVGQVSEVVVRGWDPIQKQSFKSQPEKLADQTADKLASASKKVINNSSGKPSQLLITNAPVSSEKEAQAYAKSVAKRIANGLITGNGTSVGYPELQVSTKLKLTGVGRFEGEYSVSQVTHTISESGYQTSFEVNNAPDISDAPMGAENGMGDRRRQYGVMIGLVIDNKDPDALGRVKVKFPGWSDDEIGHWARMATPMAGDQRGFFFLPEVKDEVLVAFEQGDMSRPYIVGALWNGKDKPPDTNPDGQNNIRLIQSRSSSLIRFDDTKGVEKIEIQDKNGENSITIDIAKGAIVIKSSKDISIEAAQGTIKLNAQNIEISSTASTKIEATAELNLSATGNTNVKGTMINLN